MYAYTFFIDTHIMYVIFALQHTNLQKSPDPSIYKRALSIEPYFCVFFYPTWRSNSKGATPP